MDRDAYRVYKKHSEKTDLYKASVLVIRRVRLRNFL